MSLAQHLRTTICVTLANLGLSLSWGLSAAFSLSNPRLVSKGKPGSALTLQVMSQSAVSRSERLNTLCPPIRPAHRPPIFLGKCSPMCPRKSSSTRSGNWPTRSLPACKCHTRQLASFRAWCRGEVWVWLAHVGTRALWLCPLRTVLPVFMAFFCSFLADQRATRPRHTRAVGIVSHPRGRFDGVWWCWGGLVLP